MCSCLRTYTWVVVAGSAVAILGGLSASSCQSSSEVPAGSPATASEGDPAGGATNEESPVAPARSGTAEAAPAPANASESESESPAGAATTATTRSGAIESPAPEAGTPSPIGIETRRTAAGLPDALPGYLSWHRLARSEPLSRCYVYFPFGAEPEGTTIEEPLETGAIVLAERKGETDTFIRSILVASRGEDDWTFSAYRRESAGAPFAPGDAETARAALEPILNESTLELAGE